ncbi:MAG: hypothetical protein ACFE8A_00720 [Candidatus Hodarchaeota archaeon]
MRNIKIQKRNSWSYSNKSVRENIQKNEFVSNVRAKLLKKKNKKTPP